MQWLKRMWQDSGTKMIGWVTTVIGVIGTLDANTIGAVTKFLGPKVGGNFALVCMIAGGVLTTFRGHKNTADIAKQVVDQASTKEVIASAAVVTAAAKTAVAADDKAASITTQGDSNETRPPVVPPTTPGS